VPMILALDLGKRTGFCIGPVGAMPTSGAWVLGKSGDPPGAVFNQLVWALEKCFRMRPHIDLIVKEQNKALQIAGRVLRNEASIFVTTGLHAHVLMMGARFGVRIEDANMDKVRMHFIGRARMGDRDELKAAIVQRAKLLGYIPKDSHDNDRADACATWDFACSLYGGRAAMYHLT
jgi:hypothetical protein